MFVSIHFIHHQFLLFRGVPITSFIILFLCFSSRRNNTAKTLSRNKVLELLNMSEDEFIEKGASIKQMDIVFKHFNIPAKLYSLLTKSFLMLNPQRIQE